MRCAALLSRAKRAVECGLDSDVRGVDCIEAFLIVLHVSKDHPSHSQPAARSIVRQAPRTYCVFESRDTASSCCALTTLHVFCCAYVPGYCGNEPRHR